MKSLCQARWKRADAMDTVRHAGLLTLFFILPALYAEPPLPQATNLWTFTFAFSMHYNFSSSTPAVAPDGTIYAGAFDGKLYALSPDGKPVWRFQAGREIKSSPAIGDDGTIYFGSRDHALYAVTPAGKLKWKFATGAWVDSSPALATNGAIYFGSWDKNFYALNPDGSLKWKFPVGGIVDSSPAIAADGAIYFGAHNKKFYALDAAGKLRWTFLTGAEITSSPAIGEEGSIYFSSTDGNLYRLKPDGQEMWRCHIGGGSDGSPVLAENGNLFIAAAYQTLMISPAGKKLADWESPSWIDATPAVAQGTVLFSSPNQELWAGQPDGRALWTAELKNAPASSPVISDQGEVYFSCGQYVQAVQPPIPLRPALSSWPMFRADARHTGRVRSH